MTTEATSNRQAFEYWSVRDIDQPIGIVPFPCGRYVCPNHTVDETIPAIMCVPLAGTDVRRYWPDVRL
jgi:hypothetical protein